MCVCVCVQALLANFANLGSRRIRYPSAICVRSVYSVYTFFDAGVEVYGTRTLVVDRRSKRGEGGGEVILVASKSDEMVGYSKAEESLGK